MRERFNKNMKVYLSAFGFWLVIFAVIVSANCRHNNIATVPKQSINTSLPANTPPNSNQENRGQNMNQSKLTAVSQGSWGATGISLVVEESVVKIEYDCANGEIDRKLTINENGEFYADGFHTVESFGPVRVDNPPKPQPAHYEGKISGDTMMLKVTLTETKEKIADYTLERGKTPRLHKCL
ncbi:hypothetical protein BH18ACI1_BH18ACI1_10560 [soil metagenome]